MAWTKGPTIGRGSTAAVSLATTFSGDFFAVKSIDLSSAAVLEREKSLISQLNNPYIVKCLGSDVSFDGVKSVYNLFMEYVSGGTLSEQIKKQGKLTESVIRKHAFDLLKGLKYLHAKGIAHCDIKGANILIGDCGLKIADFGCSKLVESCGGDGFSGTAAYMAPEVARGEEQGFPADIWAFGCTVIEMATGCHPWPEMKDPAAALYRIGFSGDVPECPEGFSDEGKDFVARCLMKCPNERWTAEALLQHPFVTVVAEENRGLERSPTSVTDQGFWDAFEASDSETEVLLQHPFVTVVAGENRELERYPTSVTNQGFWEAFDPTEVCLPEESPAWRIRDLIGDGFPVGFADEDEEEDWLTVRGNEIEEDLIEEIEIESSILMEDSLVDCWNGEIGGSSTSFQVQHCEIVNDFFCDVNFDDCFNGIISSSTSNFPTPFPKFASTVSIILACNYVFRISLQKGEILRNIQRRKILKFKGYEMTKY